MLPRGNAPQRRSCVVTFSVDWNFVMVGAVLAALPTVLVYAFLGRFFIRGMGAGSVKG